MATRSVTVERARLLLLPRGNGEMGEWVADDEMVYFVLGAVAQMDLREALCNVGWNW